MPLHTLTEADDAVQVFDSIALRVVVSDGSTAAFEPAMRVCYQVLQVVRRLWKTIRGEDDDYIGKPKTSGYMSIHTAVVGPGGVPIEVQVRSAHAARSWGLLRRAAGPWYTARLCP
jgi:(p)ppGpp synthase/HD superfamily hydrolase